MLYTSNNVACQIYSMKHFGSKPEQELGKPTGQQADHSQAEKTRPTPSIRPHVRRAWISSLLLSPGESWNNRKSTTPETHQRTEVTGLTVALETEESWTTA